MLNLERRAYLKVKLFIETTFLKHLTYKIALEYLYVIPANNNLTEFGIYDLKEIKFKFENDTLNQN